MKRCKACHKKTKYIIDKLCHKCWMDKEADKVSEKLENN